MSLRRAFFFAAAGIVTMAAVAGGAAQKRRITPVNTPATATQPVNLTKGDTARLHEAIRARSSHYHRPDGATVWVDTASGAEWIDSSTIARVPTMKFPLLHAATVGVNLWDPAMRLFGQHYGIGSFFADLSLHNRYFPTVEIGLGAADFVPDGFSYTYRSGLAPFFKVGVNYNFLYNSDPDYAFFATARYGLSTFGWQVDNITLDSDYWGATTSFDLPRQRCTAGWAEIGLGLRVAIGNGFAAGWTVRYQGILHETASQHGQPAYIPGFGMRGASIGGSFTVSYTIPLNKRVVPAVIPATEADTLAAAVDSISL